MPSYARKQGQPGIGFLNPLRYLNFFNLYHLWYYHSEVWKNTRYLDVPIWKSVSDLWNYQEILSELRPTIIIEFGSAYGGSALYFSHILEKLGQPFKILSVDITHKNLSVKSDELPNVEFFESSSTSPVVAEKIARLREELPGPVFAILDSDHSRDHVYNEMLLLRPLLKSGDYMIVEDSNINGHPVAPLWGAGPYEAIKKYCAKFPSDFERDQRREKKFGFTWAPRGFLKRV